jgi:hypothetical protein
MSLRFQSILLGSLISLATVLLNGCEKKATGTPSNQVAAPANNAPAPTLSAPALAGPQLNASNLIGEADVARVVPGAVKQKLAGVASTPNYDGLRFSPAGSSDLGVTLQWWRFSTPGEAAARYKKNLEGYGTTQPTNEVGQQAFRANGYKHQALVFLDSASNSVVALNCGEATCAGDAGGAKLLELAKSIQPHLGH